MTNEIQTLTIQRTFHGVVVMGKTWIGGEEWWSKWKTATRYELESSMASLNVVFHFDAPLLSGIVSACFIKDTNSYEIVVPLQPLSFGVRLLLVYDNAKIYYKIDPDCYTDLPPNFVAWMSGMLSQFHDQTIGHIVDVKDRLDRFKKEDTISGINAWNIFTSAYNVAVQNATHREAYSLAVTNTEKEIERLKNVLTSEGFKSRLQNALNDATELFKVLKSVDDKHDNFMSCIDDMTRLREMLDDFVEDRSSFDSEFTLARRALEYQSLYETLFKKTTDNVHILNQDANISQNYVCALGYALEVIKKDYQTSDLYAVIYALSFIEKNPRVRVTYDVANIKNAFLKAALKKYNQEKLQPNKAESARIEKAKSFLRETSVLSWKLQEFDELLENHRKMVIHRPLSDNILDNIQAQFQNEKWGLFYRDEIGLESLMRNGTKLEDYIADINKISIAERTTSVEKILKSQILKQFNRFNYWGLKKESLFEVINTLQILCSLVTRLGSIPIALEPVWPNLPIIFNSSKAIFRSGQDVENFVISYQNFKKPTPRAWPVAVSALDRSNFNTTFDRLVGEELNRLWNKSVVKVYDDARKRVEEAADKYENTIKEILRLAEDNSNDLRAVFLETIKKCHTLNRNTNKYDTWWELVDVEFCRRSPCVFKNIANVADRQSFMQQVVENKWRVSMLPNEGERKQWSEELCFVLLRRAHNETAKHLLTFVEKCLANEIEKRRDIWCRGFERMDRTVDEYYDVEFISANDETDTVLVSCTQFHQLQPELNRILVYATRIYGLQAIGVELFNWIADGCGRWMVTDHIKEQFVSSHNFANFDDPVECFYGALTTLLFDFLNVYDVCCTHLLEQRGTNLYHALVKSFPIYGRIVTKIRGWNAAYGNETQTVVDVLERLSLSADYEIPEKTLMTAIENIAVTKQMIRLLDKKIDIPFLEQCLSGEMWSSTGTVHGNFETWKKMWFYNARKLTFDCIENKLTHAVDERKIHSYDDLTVSCKELKSFIERHAVARNVTVKFFKPTESRVESTLPPSIINAGLLDDLQDVFASPEEDDYTFDEELFDSTAFASFSFYTAPYFPTLEQELFDAGVETTELQLVEDEEDETVASEISDLISDIKDLQLDGTEKDEEYCHKRRFIVKSKDFKRHLISLFDFATLND